MKEITPIIGHWYKAANGSSKYIIKLDSIHGKGGNSFKWKCIGGNKNWYDCEGGFNELIEEIPCPEEFMEKHKIINYEIY